MSDYSDEDEDEQLRRVLELSASEAAATRTGSAASARKFIQPASKAEAIDLIDSDEEEAEQQTKPVTKQRATIAAPSVPASQVLAEVASTKPAVRSRAASTSTKAKSKTKRSRVKPEEDDGDDDAFDSADDDFSDAPSSDASDPEEDDAFNAPASKRRRTGSTSKQMKSNGIKKEPAVQTTPTKKRGKKEMDSVAVVATSPHFAKSPLPPKAVPASSLAAASSSAAASPSAVSALSFTAATSGKSASRVKIEPTVRSVVKVKLEVEESSDHLSGSAASSRHVSDSEDESMDDAHSDVKPKKQPTTRKKRASSSGDGGATGGGTGTGKKKRARKAEFTYDDMEDWFTSWDKQKKGYISVTDLVSCASWIEEEFKSEELDAMLQEANKTGPRNMLRQPMTRVYLRDFITMMKTCGLIPEEDKR